MPFNPLQPRKHQPQIETRTNAGDMTRTLQERRACITAAQYNADQATAEFAAATAQHHLDTAQQAAKVLQMASVEAPTVSDTPIFDELSQQQMTREAPVYAEVIDELARQAQHDGLMLMHDQAAVVPNDPLALARAAVKDAS